MEEIIKICEDCGNGINLTNKEFDILLCPNCNGQMDEYTGNMNKNQFLKHMYNKITGGSK